ncbi:hypothetical protein [Frateuria sp. Soil773]|nr:hypothetical protein [Frateuria sp. Soil773]
MNYLTVDKHPLDKYLPLLLAAFATASTLFGLGWVLDASLHLPF